MMKTIIRTKQQAIDLHAKLLMANFKYHLYGKSIMLDEEYDSELNVLKEWLKENPPLPEDNNYFTLVNKIGGLDENSKNAKVTHKEIMGSLDNVFTIEEAMAFNPDISEDNKLVGMAKFDGLAMTVHYINGIFKLAATRGDGHIGENVTVNAATISTIPQIIPYDGEVEVRGEVMITKYGFKKLNEEMEKRGLKRYSNSRNAVSGLLRSINPTVDLTKYLVFFAYGAKNISLDTGKENIPETYMTLLRYLPYLGFCVKRHRSLETPQDVADYINYFTDLREDYDVDIDGIVLHYNNMDKWVELGHKTTTPNYAVAYKFPAQKASCTLLGVNWQIGRTGVLTPVAELEGVVIGGVSIFNVTLHNLDEIKRLGIMIGDKVIVSRQGDVIPKIIGYLDRDDEQYEYHEIVHPSECPACSTTTVVNESGAFLYCPNSLSCGARLSVSIEHFASRNAMDIRGLGTGIIEQLIKLNLIHDFTDIYSLHEHRDLLIKQDGFGESSVDKLLKAIENTKRQYADRLLYGIGIPGVGHSTAVNILSRMSLEQLFVASEDQLMEVDDLGEITARSIIDWLSVSDNSAMLLKLIAIIDPEAIPKQTDELRGLVYATTGTFTGCKRGEVEKAIITKGGKITSKIRPGLNGLIYGANGGSKVDEAIKMAVPLIPCVGSQMPIFDGILPITKPLMILYVDSDDGRLDKIIEQHRLLKTNDYVKADAVVWNKEMGVDNDALKAYVLAGLPLIKESELYRTDFIEGWH